ncbi:MAG: hypothetical protein GX602_03625 [Dehalococcoidales bacterium]|nr:hypothetical protein [Dehalococcoidales bacterium]
MVKTDKQSRPSPKRAIFVQGPINEHMVYELTPQIIKLQHENRDPISVYIDSPGGYLSAQKTLWHILNSSNQDYAEPCQIITVVTNLAASAAADLLASGDYAIAFPHSRIIYHGVRFPRQRDESITIEASSLLTSELRSLNEEYAKELMEKIEFRFMFRFIELSRQFSKVRNENPSQDLSEFDCFKMIILEHLSEEAEKLFYKAIERHGRYDELLDIVKKFRKYRTKAKTEALQLKAMIDYELNNHLLDINWTFLGEGLDRLNQDFFHLNEHLSPSEGNRFVEFCKDWGSLALSGDEEKELNKFKGRKRERELVEKVKSKLEPIWSFFIALCHTLQEGENELTAEDAYYLGLIDEVLGDEDLYGFRKISEDLLKSKPGNN